MKHYDLIVVGGGTSGAIAALSAARSGRKVLLVESGAYIGGLAAIGMTWGGFFDNDYKQVIGGIPDELVRKCFEIEGRGYFQYHGTGDKWITGLASVDPETFWYIIEKEFYAAGCEILLFSLLNKVCATDKRINSVSFISRLGEIEASADYYIDATGNMELACKCGAAWDHGNKGKTQCTSNMFRVLNVYMDKYEAFLEKEINTNKTDSWKKETGAIRRGIQYWCPWKNDGFDDMPKSLGIYYHGKSGDVILNCTSVDINPLDVYEFSKAEFKLREEAFKVLSYLKKNTPGFEHAYLAQIYEPAARESRRLIGDYTMTIDDVVDHTRFHDSIGQGAYPPDVHSPEGTVHIPSTRDFRKESDGAYDLPLSMMTFESPNCLVIGKCVSATFEAQSAIRGIGPCMVEGEGAGLAAAMAVSEGIDDIHDVDIDAVRTELKKRGVLL